MCDMDRHEDRIRSVKKIRPASSLSVPMPVCTCKRSIDPADEEPCPIHDRPTVR